MAGVLVKLKDIGNIDDVCPYCSKLLTKRPQRKAKCPHCERFIFVRTRPTDRKRVLVTENGAKEIEEQWGEIHNVPPPRPWKKKGFDEEKKLLAKKFGREPSDNDVIWSLLNKELITHAGSQHWGLYRNTVFEMGELLRSESRWSEALNRYLEVCYLDLNGPTNYGDISDIDPKLLRAVLGEEIKPFKQADGQLYPGVLAIVEHLVKNLEMSPGTMRADFLKLAARVESSLGLPVSAEVAWKSLENELFHTQPTASNL